MNPWQLVFLSGAIFNVLIAAAFALAPTTTLSLLGFADPLANPAWYALFWWLVTVFGIGYYMVSRNPEAHRGIAFMGLIGKLGVWVIATGLWIQGHIPVLFYLIACGDLLYSLLFLWFLARSRSSARTAFA
jgi:predicted membrane channel-forming protein YqfA (hemolysin III family)